MVRTSAVRSPPPSPTSLLSAQLVVAKAEEAKLKAKKRNAKKSKVVKDDTGKGKKPATSTKESVPEVIRDDSDVEVVDVTETVKYVPLILPTRQL